MFTFSVAHHVYFQEHQIEKSQEALSEYENALSERQRALISSEALAKVCRCCLSELLKVCLRMCV
jgi:hypothetical protein